MTKKLHIINGLATIYVLIMWWCVSWNISLAQSVDRELAGIDLYGFLLGFWGSFVCVIIRFIVGYKVFWRQESKVRKLLGLGSLLAMNILFVIKLIMILDSSNYSILCEHLNYYHSYQFFMVEVVIAQWLIRKLFEKPQPLSTTSTEDSDMLNLIDIFNIKCMSIEMCIANGLAVVGVFVLSRSVAGKISMANMFHWNLEGADVEAFLMAFIGSVLCVTVRFIIAYRVLAVQKQKRNKVLGLGSLTVFAAWFIVGLAEILVTSKCSLALEYLTSYDRFFSVMKLLLVFQWLVLKVFAIENWIPFSEDPPASN